MPAMCEYLLIKRNKKKCIKKFEMSLSRCRRLKEKKRKKLKKLGKIFRKCQRFKCITYWM